MAEQEDPADVAARLERALERIASLSRVPRHEDQAPNTARIAARLDHLIAQLRSALGAPPAP